MPQIQGWKVLILLAVAFCGMISLIFLPAIPQDPDYHRFADERSLFGIRNFWNVVSNVLFIVVGAFGIARIAQLKDSPLRSGYAIFCFSIALIGLGSSYYHDVPTTASLVWDRLPMAVAFMALLATVVADSVSPRAGKILLVPVIFLGIASVVYWHVSETQGAGDLRFYGFVQALPVVYIPLILALFGLKRLRAKFLWWAFITYLLAKLAEYLDHGIYASIKVISGHSLKHMLAALAILWVILAFSKKAEPGRQS